MKVAFLRCEAPKFSFFGWHRCGRCRPCRRQVAWEWTQRAVCEARFSDRTLFLTLTFRDEKYSRYKTVQDFMKRFRKNSGLSVRYLAVLEKGERNGRRHFHLLVHGPKGLKVNGLRGAWKLGITHCRVAKPGDYRYVCTYATKDFGERVRASQSYGTFYFKQIIDRLLPVYVHFPRTKFLGFRKDKPGRIVLPRKVLRSVDKLAQKLAAVERERLATLKKEHLDMRYGFAKPQISTITPPFLGVDVGDPGLGVAQGLLFPGDPR